MESEVKKEVTLGGVTYLIPEADDMPLEQDMYIMELVMESGLHSLDKGNKDFEATATDIIMVMYKSGNLFNLLGAVLVPQEKEWTPQVAAATSLALSKVKGKEKSEVLKIMSMVLAGFFASGVGESMTSPKSSPDPS